MNVSVEMFTYANALGEEKRLAPTDDIVTAIVNAEVDGERLSDMEFDMFFMLLSVAGNETTRNAITHGMLAFPSIVNSGSVGASTPSCSISRRRRSCGGPVR